jgi:hypothetical protein
VGKPGLIEAKQFEVEIVPVAASVGVTEVAVIFRWPHPSATTSIRSQSSIDESTAIPALSR